jgi:hypothetical protein
MTRIAYLILAAAIFVGAPTASRALEGSSAAGPIGGTDIRSAQVLPPGFYGGAVFFYAEAFKYLDGNGNVVLPNLELTRKRVGPFLLWVPALDVAGGRLVFAGIAPVGQECGRLVLATPKRCISGAADPYVEVTWTRYLGTPRKSRWPDAFPVAAGLTVAFGFGVVIPVGTYNAFDATVQGLTLGNNIWDFAPVAAFTYIGPPIIADGTEISAKFYWNNYLTNPATQYYTGSLLNIDFAVSEKIGRFQVGLAGLWAKQIEDDRINGVRIEPDGRRGELLMLGPVLAYDMPELPAVVKLKVLTSVKERNTVRNWGVALTIARKLL